MGELEKSRLLRYGAYGFIAIILIILLRFVRC